jgi:glutathione S-transferase
MFLYQSVSRQTGSSDWKTDPGSLCRRGASRRLDARLDGGPFLAGRAAPSLPDFSAYPQFALYYQAGFRGGDDILGSPEIMSWLARMKHHLGGRPPMLPEHVCKQEIPS